MNQVIEKSHKPRSHTIVWMVIVSAGILFLASSVRHGLFQSTAYDLSYFDQAIYLISQGETPIVSFWGYHFMGGHADWILYPLALLYKLYPSVYWLFAVQSVSLGVGALPTWHLARQAGIDPPRAGAIALAYLLYPLVFNINLFDFHAEVIAVPLLLGAVLAARSGQVGWFCAAILLMLGCRDALSLTVAAMGIWLLVWEKRRLCGAIAIAVGMGYFLLATQVIIPSFRAGGVEAVARYGYLGNSLLEIVQNLILKPQLVWGGIFTTANLEYCALLFLPVVCGLSLRQLAPLVPAVPTLAMNLLSTASSQKDLLHQYSVPIFPFLILAVIATLAKGKGLVQNRRGIILCSLVGFVVLAKFGYFGSRYLSDLGTWQATQAAIAQVPAQVSLLTTNQLAPHLAHRKTFKLVLPGFDINSLDNFEAILLASRSSDKVSSPELTTALSTQLKQKSNFNLAFQQENVYLFLRR